MRKSIFFTIVCSLCVLNFSAFSATRAGSNQTTTGVSRSATTVSRTTPSAAKTTTATSSVVSRAATKQQKALNPGTKVASAAENTAIPSECQDAFYGCMDAFCMLDNASGGRCQCSDRITELDQVLEDILKLDDQTYLMATEGVERIQMGEAADAIISRAKAAGDTVLVKEEEKAKKQSRTLDLSMWNSNIFNTDDNLFDEFDSDSLVSTFADKRGEELYTASAKMCASQITEQCKSYSSMLQLVYAQKIKSDCVGYENSLRAQKIQSQQKLQTAQKALRDAALEEYQNQNKYATLGECTIAFTECMQTNAGCGKDYTGCVTLAAQENVRNNTAGSRAKQKKIKGAISGADITLAVSTMNQLLAKKPMCESVTKQCINVNKNDAVWESFLANAAPALKSAELIAEQNLRSNCLPSLAECYKTACKDNFRNDEGYDACLSNPELYKSFCKVQLEPCLEATGGSYDNPTESSLWNSLIALLKAIQVDTCTAEVKTCLTDRCGSDYSECIGLSTESIGNLCPIDSLTACVQNGNYSDVDAIREYVAQVAMGLTLQIDNALANACQNAANDAMIRVCGDTENCDGMVDKNFGTNTLKYKVCQVIVSGNTMTINEAACKDRVAQITKEELGLNSLSADSVKEISSINSSGPRRITNNILNTFVDNQSSRYLRGVFVNYINAMQYSVQSGETMMYSPLIQGAINWDLDFKFENGEFACNGANNTCSDDIVGALNDSLNRIVNYIESDPKVQYCMSGRKVQGFNEFNGIDSTDNARFPNLTKQMRQDIADALYAKVLDNYNEKLSELEAKQDEDYLELASLYAEVAKENSEKEKATVAGNQCSSLNKNNKEWNYEEVITAVYSESTKTCTKTTTIRTCAKPKKANKPKKRYCKKWNDPVETVQTIQM